MVQKICTETSILNCSSLLLSFEIANQVLAHDTEAMTHEDGLPYHGSNSDIFPGKSRFFNGRKIFL